MDITIAAFSEFPNHNYYFIFFFFFFHFPSFYPLTVSEFLTMNRLPFSRKLRNSPRPTLMPGTRRRASDFFSRRGIEASPGPTTQNLAPEPDPPTSPSVHVANDGAFFLGTISAPTSSQSSIFSLGEPSTWMAEPSEYDDYINSNTLDADSGRRLQALQTLMCNPDLSPSVRSILATAYRQFERQSARPLETLPPYSHDCKPPPYLVR